MEMVIVFASAIVMEALGLGLAIGYMAGQKREVIFEPDERLSAEPSSHQRQLDRESENG